MLTLLAFIVTLGLLVTVHEYGHYWVAKRCGIKVQTFSIGFGKPLLTWQRGETTWQLAMLPLGGYVKMLDEREAPVAPFEQHRAFNQQHPWKKIAVVLAGPMANLILACALYAGLNGYGFDAMRAVAGQVAVDSPAARAGIRSGDEIVRVGEHDIETWDQLFIALIDEAGGDTPIEMKVRSPGEGERTVALPPVAVSQISPQLPTSLGLLVAPLSSRIAQVTPGSAAARAGLRAGDTIVALDGLRLKDWSALQAEIARRGGQAVELTVKRDGQEVALTATPEVATVDGRKVGRLGVVPSLDQTRWAAQRVHLQYGPVEAIGQGLSKAWTYARITLVMFGRMLVGAAPLDQISGPVTIAVYAGESARAGIGVYIDYLALISLSLAVLNLLPIPLLDGGHLMYHTAELLTGRPVPARLEAIGQRIGLALLLGLMALALFNDFNRFLPG
ncbi:zinc metalloprotease [Chitiniphilus shinanonensis]|uniref:Zinc metalloprotease n=1 Tax=Chitiniphilus shinanonensis TaxID=553088 RepID=A0ABQ6BQ24_9NEIS|nr:RIP metalloprotease RseP [Chitiniphilus shinanonensis]GLS04125.1 zinc metalloprotease [Chitiniphilus shinanonensis]